MFKNLLLAVLFFVSCTHLFAQSSNSDSVLIEIKKITNDSVRTEKLFAFGEKLIVNRSPKAQKFQEELEKLYLSKGDEQNLGKLYSRFGFAYISAADYTGALPNYLKAINVYEKISNPTAFIRVYQDLMWINLQLKEFKTAENYLNKALAIANQYQIKPKQAEVYNFFGILYDSQNQFPKAIDSYKKALGLNDSKSNIYNQMSTLTNLGISLRRTKHYDEALRYMLISDSLSKKVNHVYYLQASAQNLAELTYEMKNYELAEGYILEALKYKKSEELVVKRGLFENLRKIYLQKKDYKAALSYADSLIDLNDKVFNENKIKDLRELEAKYNLSLKDKQNSEQAFLNLKQASELANYKRIVEINSQEQRIAKLNLILANQKASNDKLAQEKMISKKDLLAKRDSDLAASKLSQEQFKLSSAKKTNYILYGVLIVFSFLILLLVNFYINNKRLNAVVVRQKNELLKSNTDKDKIFSIVGHDLRSPFNTLKSFVNLLDVDHISQENLKIYGKQLRSVISRTSILLDNILNWANSQINGYKPRMVDQSLKDIIETEIDNLAEEAKNKNIQVQNNINESLFIKTDSQMLSIIIRNILSNSVKFTPENGEIIFDCYQENEKTTLTIRDNGIGINEFIKNQFNDDINELTFTSTRGTLNEAGTGIGLYLVKNFTKILNAKINVQQNTNRGTIFKLEI